MGIDGRVNFALDSSVDVTAAASRTRRHGMLVWRFRFHDEHGETTVLIT